MIEHSITAAAGAALKEYGLDPDAVNNCSLCNFEAGDIIFKQGSPVEHLFIVLNGKIKVCLLAGNGKDLTLCFYVSSGILGDVEFMQEDKSASATSIAVLPSACIKIPSSRNFRHLHDNTQFMNQVAKGLSTKLQNSSNAHIASALYSSEERLCSYILMAEHNGLFTDILSDVSKSIGISYRHLFRVLNDLCRIGVLERKGSAFKILDKQYLLRKRTRP